MNPTMAPALGSSLEQRVDERMNQALVGDLRRQGAIVIRQPLTPHELATLRNGIEANLAQPRIRAKIASRPDDRGRSSRTSATGSSSTARHNDRGV